MSNITIDNIDIIAPFTIVQNFMFFKICNLSRTTLPNQQMIFSYKKEKDFLCRRRKFVFLLTKIKDR